MKNSYMIWIAVVVVVVLGTGLWLYSQMGTTSGTAQAPVAATTSDGMTPAQMAAMASTSGSASGSGSTGGAASGGTSVTSGAPAPQSFKVNGNDETADLETITVPKGTPVSITFGADAGTTYHGGLDFRSPVVSTGTITPGSTKTVTFTADKSFSFQPYWPATNIAKPYTIKVVVQ